MNYGLHICASGALSSLHRQDVFANNLANINTVGFKPDTVEILQRDAARVEDSLAFLPSNLLLERLGAGVMPAPTRINFGQGPLQTTSNPLDLAIQGDGFFVVRDDTSQVGDAIRLTRDGRFTRDARGRLVMVGTGLPVLDTANRTITLADTSPVSIDPQGVIRQNNLVVARIQFVDVPDRTALRKYGDNLYTGSPTAIENRAAASGLVRQNHVEQAAVDPIAAMMEVTGASRAAEANFAMIQYHDRTMDRAINVLARTA